jgi:hypothetical protein
MLLLYAVLGSPAARAQTSLAGTWGHLGVDFQDWALRGPGPDPADFTGLPINAEARRVALNYSAEQLSLPERQCLLYAPPYTLMDPGGFSMWPDYDPNTGKVIAWNTSGQAGDVSGLKIWMDGRAHPSRYADHPVSGFTTGVWQGAILSTYTTHMKRGYLRRNGTPQSDQATMTLHFIRHGTLLTISGEIDDPVYMTRSYILSRVLELDPTNETSTTKGGCHPAVEVATYANIGTVPHYVDGNNPAGDYMTKQYNISRAAAMGGAETMYPEFRKSLRSQYSAPAKCDKYCCGWDGFGGAADTIPACPTFFVIKTPQPYIPPPPFTP